MIRYSILVLFIITTVNSVAQRSDLITGPRVGADSNNYHYFQYLYNFWKAKGGARYFEKIQNSADAADLSLVYGNSVLTVYKATGNEKYLTPIRQYNAAASAALKLMPDILYETGIPEISIAIAYKARYANMFNQPAIFDTLTTLLVQINDDLGLGLKDNNRGMRLTPGIGWLGITLVDVLDQMKTSSKHKDSLVALAKNFTKMMFVLQDRKSGLWLSTKITPRGPQPVVNSDICSMIIFTMASAIRSGYVPTVNTPRVKKAFWTLPEADITPLTLSTELVIGDL